MSPVGPSNGTSKDSHEEHKHTKHDSRKHHQHGKKSISARDDEEAPLLADDARDEDIEANAVEERPTDKPVSQREKTRIFFQKVGHWIWSNKMILALVLLLTGGIIAVTVYFTGMVGPLYPLLFSSRSYSWRSPRITIGA